MKIVLHIIFYFNKEVIGEYFIRDKKSYDSSKYIKWHAPDLVHLDLCFPAGRIQLLSKSVSLQVAGDIKHQTTRLYLPSHLALDLLLPSVRSF